MSDNNSMANFPPAVVRALEILELLAENSSALSQKEIVDIAKIPHASAYRIIKCLEHYGYIRESLSQRGRYKPGYRLAMISKMAFDGAELISAAMPYMKELAHRTKQACQLCVLDDCYVVTLDQALPVEAITIIAKLGEAVAVNASASGKILMALLPIHKRHELLERSWHMCKKNTDYTLIDKDIFLSHLESTAQNMYGTDFEEFALGIGCLAVPIYNYENNPIAALGFTGNIESYRDERTFNDMLCELRDASNKIRERLYPSR